MTAPQLTPAELFNLLLSELSASGSVPLQAEDPTQPNLTLREAIGAILWKNTFLLGLLDRPRDPTKTDDLLGHVLSLRAETLQNQALLAALCERANIDVKSILTQVTGSFA